MKKFLKTGIVKPNVALFYICYTVFMVSTMFKRVLVFGDIAGSIYQICLVMLALTCIISISRMPRKKMLILYAITILVAIVRFASGSNIPLSLWLLVVAGRNINFDNLVKYDLAIKIISLIVLPCLYFSGLTYVNMHYRGDEVRHSMGFSNPNVFSTYVMAVLAEILYLRRSRLGIFDILLSIVAIFLIDYYADSRTQIVCVIGLVVVLFANKFFSEKKGGKKIKDGVLKKVGVFVVDHAFTILMMFSALFAFGYSFMPDNIKEPINSVTSGRLSAASSMVEKYDVNLFGQKVELIYRDRALRTGEDTTSLDNAYIYLLLMTGLLYAVSYAFFMKKYMQKARAEGNIIRYIMLVYLVGGLMEHFCLEPQLNIFLLYFIYMLYGPPIGQVRQVAKSKVKGYIRPKTDERVKVKMKGYVNAKSN